MGAEGGGPGLVGGLRGIAGAGGLVPAAWLREPPAAVRRCLPLASAPVTREFRVRPLLLPRDPESRPTSRRSRSSRPSRIRRLLAFLARLQNIPKPPARHPR